MARVVCPECNLTFESPIVAPATITCPICDTAFPAPGARAEKGGAPPPRVPSPAVTHGAPDKAAPQPPASPSSAPAGADKPGTQPHAPAPAPASASGPDKTAPDKPAAQPARGPAAAPVPAEKPSAAATFVAAAPIIRKPTPEPGPAPERREPPTPPSPASGGGLGGELPASDAQVIVAALDRLLRGPALLGLTALVLASVALALRANLSAGVLGMILGGLGLVLGGTAIVLVLSRKKGTLPIAALAINVLALVLAAVVLLGPRGANTSRDRQGAEGDAIPLPHGRGSDAPGARTKAIADLRLALLKKSDKNARLSATNDLGELSRNLAKIVPILADVLLTDPEESVRQGAAQALREIGPLAKGAYPALLHVSKEDPSDVVRESADEALRKIGRPSKADIGYLTSSLHDPNADFRASAAMVLFEIGPEAGEAIPSLRTMLKEEKDSYALLAAAMALWAIDPQQARELVPVLQKLLQDKERDNRLGSAAMLEKIGPRAASAVESLADLLTVEDDPGVRAKVAEALGAIGRKAKLAVPALGKALKDKDLSVRARAAQALGKIGAEARSAVPALREALNDPSFDVRKQAAYALGMIGPDAKAAVPELTRLLKDQDVDLRARAAQALWMIGPDAKEAVKDLEDVVANDPVARVRLDAVLALWAINEETQKVVPILIKALQDKEPLVRIQAASGLRTIGAKARDAVPALFEALHDTEETGTIRSAAADTLGLIGAPAKAAFPVLHRIGRNDPIEHVRHSANTALLRINTPTKEDVDILIAALKEGSAAYQTAALEALGMIGPDAKKAVPDLNLALKKDDANVRLYAAQALWTIEKQLKVIKVLVELLEHQDAAIRETAAITLGGIGPAAKEASASLQKKLEDPEVPVRLYSAQALWAINHQQPKDAAQVIKPIVNVLIAALKEKDPEYREVAAKALGDVGPKAREAVKEVVPALAEAFDDDEEEPVRFAAGNSLKKIDPAEAKKKQVP